MIKGLMKSRNGYLFTREVVLAVFIGSITIALMLSLYKVLRNPYGNGDFSNITDVELNKTREQELVNNSWIILKYYYRGGEDESTDISKEMIELAKAANNTIFLENIKIHGISATFSKAPYVEIISRYGRLRIEKPKNIYQVLRGVFTHIPRCSCNVSGISP